MKIKNQVIKNIIINVIKSLDYRMEVVSLINAEFLQFTIDFFKKVIEAKLNSKVINIDWYKTAFLDETLPSDDIAINSGLNKKTIHNMYKSSTKKIVIDASISHFDSLYNNIQALIENEKDIDLNLQIKFNGVCVDLNINESLIIINTLAVKRAAFRGSVWSSVGKNVEKYLMLTLCKLYQVSEKYYDKTHFIKNKKANVDREVDFFLISKEKHYRCEVKLMGAGNPESADAIIARNSDLFVADTLSNQNKAQCDELGVCWVACRDNKGYERFKLALDKFKIPYVDYNGNLNEDLPIILDSILD
ncbi:MAG: CfrBI family restriction endonuclease [Treponema sp.]